MRCERHIVDLSVNMLLLTQTCLFSQLASGLTFLPACSAVSHHFKEKRMFALGILATGSYVLPTGAQHT